MHFLAILAIFRDEDDYLEEWIQFHLYFGVDHFYLYDHGGDPNTKIILKKYVDRGIVTLIPWEMYPADVRDEYGNTFKMLAQTDCVRKYQDEFNWLILIDIDEFVYPVNLEEGGIGDVLKTVDKDKIAEAFINRYHFNSSGHKKKPDGLVIENYTERAHDYFSKKSIGNSKFISLSKYQNKCHYFIFDDMDVERIDLTGLLYLNHYYTKSYEEFMKRKGASSAYGRLHVRRGTEDLFIETDKKFSGYTDKKLLEVVPIIQARLLEEN